jgi:ABC-2 type transport system permease protein
MTGALLFLLLQSGKNRLLMRLRRMKQPKYLLGAIIGGLYFFQLFFARLFFHPRSHARPEGLAGGVGSGPEDLLLKASIGALMLFVVVVMTWVIPNKRAALVFSEAEVAFLFPAPVSRRTLVHFKLLKSQIAILFTALFVTLFFGWARSRGMLWTQALGWWVILSTLNLHQLGSSFARTMLLERGISNWKRRSVVLTSVVALVGGVAVWAWRTVPPPPRAGDIGGLEDIKYYVETVLQAGPLVYLLAPFRLVVQPYLAPDAMAFLRALVPALALLALHYVWVVRSNVAFEEASVEASRKMAERMAAARAGRDLQAPTTKKRRRPPFKLGATGFPPVAFLWKNLIGAGQAFTLRFWLLLVCIVLSVGGNSRWRMCSRRCRCPGGRWHWGNCWRLR